MDDPEVIRTAFTEAGFDADKLFEQMGNDEIKGRLAANTQNAVDRGAFGIPTFLSVKKFSSARNALARSRNCYKTSLSASLQW